MLITFAIL